jgi:hypothetical protein
MRSRIALRIGMWITQQRFFDWMMTKTVVVVYLDTVTPA